MHQQLQTLRLTIEKVIKLSDEEWNALKEPWELVKYKRKEIITWEGQVERYMYFVIEGIQRGYYLKDNDDVTIGFSFNNSFSGIPESFIAQQVSACFLEALTPSTLLRISYNQLSALVLKHRNIERWLRLSTEQLLVGMMVRQRELLAFNAEEKFKSLLTRSPHVLQMIPQKYLASYLGITPETFSRLMKNVRI